MVTASIDYIQAGLRPYAEGLARQAALWNARRLDEIPDTILLLQHTPVITLGLSGGMEDVHTRPDDLRALGVDLAQTDRGGRATFHGPGQLVAYPIMKLESHGLHAFSDKLEQVVINLLSIWGIQGQREEKYPGVWVGRKKIAAIGVAVKADVSTHGLALNVVNDLNYFNLITPCGISDRGVTSMKEVLEKDIPLDQVEHRLIQEFSAVFDRPVVKRIEPARSIATA